MKRKPAPLLSLIILFVSMLASCNNNKNKYEFEYSDSYPLDLCLNVIELEYGSEFEIYDNHINVNSKKSTFKVDYITINDSTIQLQPDSKFPVTLTKKEYSDSIIFKSHFKMSLFELPMPNEFGSDTQIVNGYKFRIKKK